MPAVKLCSNKILLDLDNHHRTVMYVCVCWSLIIDCVYVQETKFHQVANYCYGIFKCCSHHQSWSGHSPVLGRM